MQNRLHALDKDHISLTDRMGDVENFIGILQRAKLLDSDKLYLDRVNFMEMLDLDYEVSDDDIDVMRDEKRTRERPKDQTELLLQRPSEGSITYGSFSQYYSRFFAAAVI